MRQWICLGLLAVLASAAPAYPILTGPTGLVALPTAVMTPGLVVAADQHTLSGGHSRPLRGTLALGNLLEVGAAVNAFDGDVDFEHAWALNAKLGTGKIATGALALGAQYLSQQADLVPDQKAWQGYLAWTSDFCPEYFDVSGITLTLGGNWTRIRPTGGSDLEAARAFAGLEMHMLRNLYIVADYQTQSAKLGDIHPISSVAARLALNPTVTLQLGATNALGFSGREQHSLFFGAAIRLISGVQEE